MKLNELYTKILTALHVKATPEGFLTYESFDGPHPLTVKDGNVNKRLALPTPEILKAANWDEVIPFHPLSEHLNRGVSPVMNALVKVATIRLTEVIPDLMYQLLKLACEPDRHAKMSPQSQKVLSALKDASPKTLDVLEKILKRIDMTPDRKLVSIYLKRKGVYRGVTGRVCVIGFPIVEELSGTERSVWGVKLTQKDQAVLEALMEYILPGCSDVESYSALSESKVAPYFESFLEAYEKVVTQLNRVIQANHKELDNVDKLKTKIDWGNLSEDLLANRSAIPPLDGNKGTILDESPSVESSSVQPNTPPPAPAPAPVLAPTPPPMTPIGYPQQPPAPIQQQTSHPGESLADKLLRRQAELQHPQGYAPMGYPPPQNPPGYPPSYPAYPPQSQQYAPMGYPPQGAPMGYPYNQPGYPPVQQGYPMPGFPAPNMASAPVWMGATGSVVGGATPQPINPGVSGGGVSGGYLF